MSAEAQLETGRATPPPGQSGLVTFERAEAEADVLVVTNHWPTAELPMYGVFMQRQVDSLVARGLKCDVLFVRGYRSGAAYLLAALKLFTLSFSRRRRYRLVHAHGGETGVVARFYLSAPLVVSYCGDDLLGTPDAEGRIPLSSRIRRTVLCHSARLTRGTITKSSEMAAVLPAPARRRNRVVPNGVDSDRFRPIDRAEARARLGWPAEGRVVLFGADPAVPRKRYPLASAACELAGERLPDLRLEVAKDVAPEDMPLLMNAADCLILTSAIEGSPNVVKEALMCDLPVVSTPVGDTTELLADVSPSLICDATPKALAEGLVQVLDVPRRSNGRAASADLTLESIASRVEAVYAAARRR